MERGEEAAPTLAERRRGGGTEYEEIPRFKSAATSSQDTEQMKWNDPIL